MKVIPLTQGKEALVSDEDYATLSQWNWHYHQGFAKRGSEGKLIRMDTAIFGQPATHIDGDRLNNQRTNLAEGQEGQRASYKTRSDKGVSRKPYKPRKGPNKLSREPYKSRKGAYTSGFKGVSWNKHTGKWRVRANGRYLGEFDNHNYAASVYANAQT